MYAAVIKDGAGRALVFSARKTGESSDFTVDTSRLAAGAADRGPRLRAHRARRSNASYKLDGERGRATSETNVIENAIPGVRLTLKGITTQPGVGHHDAGRDRQGRASPRRSRRSSTPTTRSSPPARAELTEKSDPTATTTSRPAEGPAVRRLRA